MDKSAFLRGYSSSVLSLDKKFWKDCLVTFDTSSLLNLYGYDLEGRDAVLDAMTHLSKAGRLWLSNHVVFEFHQNRAKVARQYQTKYTPHIKALSSISKDLEAFAWSSTELADVRSKIDEAANLLAELQTKESTSGKKNPLPENDKLLGQLAELFSSAHLIGPPIKRKQLRRVHEAGRSRYPLLIPPGFADGADKPDPAMFGDLVVWEQVVAKAKKVTKPVLMVTDDLKEDWVDTVSGRAIKKDQVAQPHPSLVQEFQERVGTQFHLVSLAGFLSVANDHAWAIVPTETIEEAEKDATSSESRQRSIWSDAFKLETTPFLSSSFSETLRVASEMRDRQELLAKSFVNISTQEMYRNYLKSLGIDLNIPDPPVPGLAPEDDDDPDQDSSPTADPE